jgi:hypothetical protein
MEYQTTGKSITSESTHNILAGKLEWKGHSRDLKYTRAELNKKTYLKMNKL